MAARAEQGGPGQHPAPGRPATPGVAAARVPLRSAATRARAPLALGAAAVAAAVHLAVTDPYRPGGHPVCPLLALTGLLCAGCGAQRAVHDLAHADVAAAWAMNPLLVLAVPVAVVAWLGWLRRRWRGRAPVPAGRGTEAWVLLVVVVGFRVLRNVPALAPWLAP